MRTNETNTAEIATKSPFNPAALKIIEFSILAQNNQIRHGNLNGTVCGNEIILDNLKQLEMLAEIRLAALN